VRDDGEQVEFGAVLVLVFEFSTYFELYLEVRRFRLTVVEVEARQSETGVDVDRSLRWHVSLASVVVTRMDEVELTALELDV
jgi:hypothetical protein